MDVGVKIDNENIFIKKIYINDFILSKKFIDTSLKDVIKNVLINKFNSNIHINNKINNIVNKITNIYKEENNNKIFNLSYQPFNQEKIKFDYINNNYTKKWIIPVVDEIKSLCINEVNLDKYYQLSKNVECVDLDLKTDEELVKIEFNDKCYKKNSNIYFGSFALDENVNNKVLTPKILYNNLIDETLINYKKINLKETPFNNKEFEVLENEKMYNENSSDINISKNDIKVLKICNKDKECYYLDSKQIKTKTEIKIVPELKLGKYEMHNILKNENINITDYLVINPESIINTDYNIYLGNKISFLDEIINTKEKKIDEYFNSNKLDNLELDYNIINKVDFYSSTDYNYLNIIKRNNFENCYSIRDIKYIYNLYGLNLDNIPECYIEFIKNRLDNNIRNYSIKNTLLPVNMLILYDYYNNNINNNIDNTKLLDIYGQKYINNKYDTFDYGELYDYKVYLEYLNNLDNKVLEKKKEIIH